MIDDDDFTTAEGSRVGDGSARSVFQLGSGQTPSVAIVEAVAALLGTEPTRLPPLQEYIDTDALDVLVTDGMDGTATDVRVSFGYEHMAVTIDSYGGVEIRPR